MKLVNKKRFSVILIILVLGLQITYCTPVRMIEEEANPKKDNNALVVLLSIALLGNGNGNNICCSLTSTGTGTATSAENIYFLSYTDNEYAGYLSSTKLETGSAVTKIYDTLVYDYAISADKTKIALKSYSGSNLTFTDINGKNAQTRSIAVNNLEWDSAGRLYYDDGGKIMSIKSDFTDQKEFALTTTGSKIMPKFSSDGKNFAFVQTNSGGHWANPPANYLYVRDVSTGVEKKLNTTSLGIEYISWSPDSKNIVFHTKNGITPPVGDMYLVPTDGSTQPVLLSSAYDYKYGSCRWPMFMDDSKLLLTSTRDTVESYYSGWDGQHYVYQLATMNKDGSSLTLYGSTRKVKKPMYLK